MSLIDKLMARIGYVPVTALREELHEDVPLIEFFCNKRDFGVVPEPQPAYKHIADWFSKIPAHQDKDVVDSQGRPARDHFGQPVNTAKKCLPLLDGMSVGYVLRCSADFTLHVSEEGEFMDIIHSPHAPSPASKHELNQLGGKTSPTYPGPAIKFHNPWVIKTRPGYSTLFIPLVNSTEERFTTLGALVDTDVYPKQVNFPAIWHKRGMDQYIKAGTPLILAVPVRRQDHLKELQRNMIIRCETDEENTEISRIERVQHSRMGYYTTELRESGK